jgi:biotin transport system permease protein
MVQRIILHYFPGNSFLHRWDARCKLVGLLIVTATLLQFKVTWFIFQSGLLLSLLTLSRLPFRQFLRDFKSWVIFLFVLFLFHAFFTSGTSLPFIPWFPVSQNGIRLGGITCWRLGLILGYTILFTAVTRPRELRDAIIWFFKSIPFIPERRVGLMVSLTLRFFSTILDHAGEVQLAHKARLGERNRNPFRKAKFLALPILRRSFSSVEDVTLALIARGYRDDISIQLPRLGFLNLIPLLVFLIFLIIM